MNRSFFSSLALCRTRSRPAVTPSRLGVRSVLGSNAFPSAPSLGSTNSAADRSALFVRFAATMEGPDFSRSCIIGYGFRLPHADRCCCKRPIARPPGSRARNVAACWGLRPRRIEAPLAMSLRFVLPSATCTASASGMTFRGSIPILPFPLSTLRRSSRDARRMTRGQCGSLLLHCAGLPPAIPCRSPGAHRLSVAPKIREMLLCCYVLT